MRISSAIAVGTVLTSVTSPAAGKVGRASAFSATMSLPPEASGKKSSKTERSKQMEVASSTPAVSAGPYTSLAQWTRQTGLWCSMATPLGRPVEPEVKST